MQELVLRESGGLGAGSQRGSGAEPLLGDLEAKPPEAEDLMHSESW